MTPRGMAFFDGDLYVATEGDGRVLRFDAESGAFIDERVNDPGIAPRDIEFLPNGDLLLTDAAPSGTGDRVLLYPADGTAPRVIVNGGLGSPYQLSTTNDLNFALANFSLGQIRFFNDGTPQLLDVTLGQDSQGSNIRPFGVYPLTNGNYLVTSDRAGISVLDITDPANGLVGQPIVRGSGKYIAPACMP